MSRIARFGAWPSSRFPSAMRDSYFMFPTHLKLFTSLDRPDCCGEIGGDSGEFSSVLESSTSEGAISEDVESDKGVHGLTGGAGDSLQGTGPGLI